MKTSGFIYTALVSSIALVPAAWAAELGDPAAPLEIAEWIKRDPVDLASAKGKQVLVVEFWATWCGPCRTSIPHLTELQKKFQDRGVVFIGISDEDAAKVKPFVDGMGEKMDYTIAVDRNRKTSAGYMGAYGINGIPHAFVVDKEGRIAWHGHPMSGLEAAVEKAAQKPNAPSGDGKRDLARRKLQEYAALAAKGEPDAQLEKLGQELLTLDRELGGIEPGEKLNLAETRKGARFESAMRDYQRALASGQTGEAELEQLEAKARPLAPAGFNFARFKGRFLLQRFWQEYYRLATAGGNSTREKELAAKLAGLETDNSETLNEIAWTILTDERIKQRDLQLALKYAKAALQIAGDKDVNTLETYARALFDTGQAKEAAQQLKRAVDVCEDKDRKAELSETLKRYQEKAAAK